MEDWEIVSIEAELDRLRDEREEKEDSKPTHTATGAKSKTGCLMSIIYFLLGISLLRFVGELLGFGLHLIY